MRGRVLRSRWLTIVQSVIGAAIVVLVAGDVIRNWDQVRASGLQLAFRPGWVALSLAITWLAFAGLIEGWRGVVQGWRQPLGWVIAARIWVLASFGKYIPGKLWAIAGMVILSERAGVRAKVATGAAIVMQLLAIGTGVGVASLAVGPALEVERPGAGALMTVLGLLAFGALVVVGSATALERLWRLTGREGPPPGPPRRRALIEGIGFNLLAWLAYGTAFWALARGILPASELPWRLATGVFAASYLAGFLAPFAPGGIGVRETLIVALLQSSLGYGPALALAGASRLAFTVNEVGAALPFLLTRGSVRDVS
jgi:hypothetical protein